MTNPVNDNMQIINTSDKKYQSIKTGGEKSMIILLSIPVATRTFLLYLKFIYDIRVNLL